MADGPKPGAKASTGAFVGLGLLSLVALPDWVRVAAAIGAVLAFLYAIWAWFSPRYRMQWPLRKRLHGGVAPALTPTLSREVQIAIPPKWHRPLATPAELSAKTIQGRTVWLADLLEDGVYIRDRLLIDCLVLGPAVLIAPENGGLVSGVTFLADKDQVFLEVTVRNKSITGVTALRGCVFQGGAMAMVCFLGTRKELEVIKKQAGLL